MIGDAFAKRRPPGRSKAPPPAGPCRGALRPTKTPRHVNCAGPRAAPSGV